MQDDLMMKILELIIAVVLMLCSRYLIPYIAELLGAAKFDKLVEYINSAVKAAEKLFPESGSGKDKKAYVIEFIQKINEKLGITITDEEIDTLIESAVEDLDLAKKGV